MSRRPWGQYALCTLLIVGSLACHAIVFTSNAAFGWGLGDDPLSSLIFSALSASIDIIGIAGLSGYVGILYRDGEVWHARGYRCVIGFCMALSLVAFYGFSAAHRIEPAARALREHQAEVTAAARAEVVQDDIRKGTVELLVKQSSDILALARDKTRSKFERDAAAAQARDTQSAALNGGFRNIEVKPEPTFKDPDPQAKVIADDTGLSLTAVQKIMTLALGFAAMLLASIGTTAGVRKWPVVSRETLPPPKPIEVSLDETWPELPPADAKERNVREVAKRMLEPVVKMEDARASLEERVRLFLHEATEECEGVTIQAAAFHRHYEKWAGAHGFDTTTKNVLWRTIVKLAAAGEKAAPIRQSDGKYNIYLGRRLVKAQCMAA